MLAMLCLQLHPDGIKNLLERLKFFRTACARVDLYNTSWRVHGMGTTLTVGASSCMFLTSASAFIQNADILLNAGANRHFFLNETSAVLYHPDFTVTGEHFMRPFSHFENLMQS